MPLSFPEQTPPSSFGSHMELDSEISQNFDTFCANMTGIKIKTPPKRTIPSGGIMKDTPGQFMGYSEYAHYIHDICHQRHDSKLLLTTYIPCNPLKTNYPYNISGSKDFLTKPSSSFSVKSEDEAQLEHDEFPSCSGYNGILDFSDTDRDIPTPFECAASPHINRSESRDAESAITRKPECELTSFSCTNNKPILDFQAHPQSSRFKNAAPQILPPLELAGVGNTPSCNTDRRSINTDTNKSSFSRIKESTKFVRSTLSSPIVRRTRCYVDKRCNTCFLSRTRCKHTGDSSCETCKFMGLVCIYSKNRGHLWLKKSDQACLKHLISVVQHTLKVVEKDRVNVRDQIIMK